MQTTSDVESQIGSGDEAYSMALEVVRYGQLQRYTSATVAFSTRSPTAVSMQSTQNTSSEQQKAGKRCFGTLSGCRTTAKERKSAVVPPGSLPMC